MKLIGITGMPGSGKSAIIEISKKYHDRFLLLDDDAYHIGASLKDAGNKWFAFSLMDISLKNILISKI